MVQVKGELSLYTWIMNSNYRKASSSVSHSVASDFGAAILASC